MFSHGLFAACVFTGHRNEKGIHAIDRDEAAAFSAGVKAQRTRILLVWRDGRSGVAVAAAARRGMVP
ncbi:hypothetical protein MESS2_1590074 [Mesorhizobium metallidurans STM 2683]|uniref:Uncharacterized protein n=1 Tax=Mesorhizobium metallidurans STM 2683 TaxID=1297569 RepID=M5EMJ3_9HYPH|nr:hypothetical protein MESS2_1590074 [Mesorhizobium metallidurans STM 2683]